MACTVIRSNNKSAFSISITHTQHEHIYSCTRALRERLHCASRPYAYDGFASESIEASWRFNDLTFRRLCVRLSTIGRLICVLLRVLQRTPARPSIPIRFY